MDKKIIVEPIERQPNRHLLPNQNFDYNLTVNETDKEKSVVMSIGVLKPPLKVINRTTASTPGCSRTTASTSARGTPVTSTRYQTLPKINHSYRLITTKPLPKESSTNKAFSMSSQRLNIQTSTASTSSGVSFQHQSSSISHNQGASSFRNVYETSKSVLKYGPSKSSQNQSEMVMTNAASISMSSGRSQRHRSIKILRKHLTVLDEGNSTKKMTPSTSVENFLEQDILSKGLEVLDSLDDQTLKVLVTKVMDLINKMYGDYLAEELEKHLGPEKYREIAGQGLSTYDAFLAKKHSEINRENLCPASTSGVYAKPEFTGDQAMNAGSDTSVLNNAKCQKQRICVKLDPKMMHNSNGIVNSQSGEVEVDQKDSGKQILVKGGSSVNYKIDTNTSLASPEFSSIFGNEKKTSPLSNSLNILEPLDIDTAKLHRFSLEEDTTKIVEEVLGEEEKAAADIFILEKIDKLKKVSTPIDDNLEEHFTFGVSKLNNIPPEKIFESPEDRADSASRTPFHDKYQPRKILQVDGIDKNGMPENTPSLEKSLAGVNEVTQNTVENNSKISVEGLKKSFQQSLKAHKESPKIQGNLKFDPLVAKRSGESVLKNGSSQKIPFKFNIPARNDNFLGSLKMFEESPEVVDVQMPVRVKNETRIKDQASCTAMPSMVERSGDEEGTDNLNQSAVHVPKVQLDVKLIAPDVNRFETSKNYSSNEEKQVSNIVPARNTTEVAYPKKLHGKPDDLSLYPIKSPSPCFKTRRERCTPKKAEGSTRKSNIPKMNQEVMMNKESPSPKADDNKQKKLKDLKNAEDNRSKIEGCEQMIKEVKKSALNKGSPEIKKVQSKLKMLLDQPSAAVWKNEKPKLQLTYKEKKKPLEINSVKESQQLQASKNEKPLQNLTQIKIGTVENSPCSADINSLEHNPVENKHLEQESTINDKHLKGKTERQKTVEALNVDTNHKTKLDVQLHQKHQEQSQTTFGSNKLLQEIKHNITPAKSERNSSQFENAITKSPDLETSMNDLAQLLISLQESGTTIERTSDTSTTSSISNESFETFAVNTAKSLLTREEDCVVIEEGCVETVKKELISDDSSTTKSDKDPKQDDICGQDPYLDKSVEDVAELLINFQKSSPNMSRVNLESRKFVNDKDKTVCDDDCVLVEEKSPVSDSSESSNRSRIISVDNNDDCILVEVESEDRSPVLKCKKRIIDNERNLVNQDPFSIIKEHNYPKDLSIMDYAGPSSLPKNPKYESSEFTAKSTYGRSGKLKTLPSFKTTFKNAHTLSPLAISHGVSEELPLFVNSQASTEEPRQNTLGRIKVEPELLTDETQEDGENNLLLVEDGKDDCVSSNAYRFVEQLLRRKRNILRSKIKNLSEIIYKRTRTVRRTYCQLDMLVNIINLDRDDEKLDEFTLKCKMHNLKTIYQKVNRTFLAFKGKDVKNLNVAFKKARMAHGARGASSRSKFRRRGAVVKKELKVASPAVVKKECTTTTDSEKAIIPHSKRNYMLNPIIKTYTKVRKNIFKMNSESDVELTGKNNKKEIVYPHTGSNSFFDERQPTLHSDEKFLEDHRGSNWTPEGIVQCAIYNKDTPSPLITDIKEEMIIPDPIPTDMNQPSSEMALVKQEFSDTPEGKRTSNSLKRGQKRRASDKGPIASTSKEPPAPKPWNLRNQAVAESTPPLKRKKVHREEASQRSYSLRSRDTGNSHFQRSTETLYSFENDLKGPKHVSGI